MLNFRIFNFQLFADAGAASGEGGEGGETGVTSADAGQRLEELGVPADKREKWAKSKARRGIPTEAQREETQAETGSDGAADRAAETEIPYEQIRFDPKYKQFFDKEISDAIRKRLGNAEKDRADMQTMGESMAIMGAFYGLPDGFSVKELAEKIMADDHFVERQADEDGTDVETARRNMMDRLELQRLRKEKKLTIDRQEGIAHLDKLRKQAEESELLKSVGFSFDEEMQNDEFFKLTSPQFGLSPEQAYFAIHGSDVVNSVKQQKNDRAIAMVADTIRAGKSRPVENGAAVASPVTKSLYSSWSREEQKRWKQEAARAAARGERFTFEDFKK